MSRSASGRTWEGASSPAAVGLTRRFEAAWRAAATPDHRPDLAAFLRQTGETPGGRLALLRADMTLRWEAGERLGAEEYRRRHPGVEGETLVALVYEEYCLREEADESPEPEEYLARYPGVASSLRRVLEIHGLVGSGRSADGEFDDSGPSSAAFPAAGETIAGFRLMEELGRGAFARVFRAQERQLADRPVALKVARAGSREPQTLARLQHTHIVPVYSYLTDPATGLHLLCMPFYGRVTLARLLADAQVKGARSGADLVSALDRLGASEPPSAGRSAGRAALARRPFARAIAWWGARMAEALEHAHDRGVLHRDVKPSNVLVTADGMPMLLDFNLAREVLPVEGADGAAPAPPGGTLDYMAPEQLEELADGIDDRADARSDVYGLGVLLYESLAGCRPFAAPRDANSAPELLDRAAADRRAGAPSLRGARPDLPPALTSVVARCLEPEPSDRYACAADLAADLQAVADDRPLRFAREPWPARASRWLRRHRRLVAAATPAVLALAGTATLVARERSNRSRAYAVEYTRTLHSIDEASGSEKSGDFALAKVQYESAFRPDPNPGEPADPTAATRSDAGVAPTVSDDLAVLRQQARFKYLLAARTEQTRAAVDDLVKAGGPLRFRLGGFGGDLEAAARELTRRLAPFFVLEDRDWARRPDLKLLDRPRRARLDAEVDELLFLRALTLDRVGNQAALRHDRVGSRSAWAEALDLCGRAPGVARPSDPWLVLRDRLARRLDDAPRPAAPAPPVPSAAGLTALVRFQWGLLRFYQGSRADGLGWFHRAVEDEPGNAWYQFMLAFALDNPDAPGDLNETLRRYDVAIALQPDSPWPVFNRAQYYRNRNFFDKARDDLQQAIHNFRALPAADRDPVFETQTRLERGLVRQTLGDLPGAREDYALVIAADGKGDYARAARLNGAKLDAESGATGRARAEFDDLVADYPGDRQARLGRAQLALRLPDPAAAEADLDILVRPEVPAKEREEARSYRALARLLQGRAAEALADADEALRRQPSPRTERVRDRARIALGDPAGVDPDQPDRLDTLPMNGAPLRADLRRLADRLRRPPAPSARPVVAPDQAAALETRLTLAVVLAALGDPRAEAEADRAVASAGLSPRVYQVRARIRRHAGRLAEARRDADVALKLDPDDPRAWTLRGEIRTAAGDPSGGLADLQRAWNLGFEPASRAPRAVALLAAGDARGALLAWGRTLAFDSDDPYAYLGRAEAYLGLRQWDQALADLERAAAWAEDRPALGLRVVRAYAKAVWARPSRLPRLLILLGRVAVAAFRDRVGRGA